MKQQIASLTIEQAQRALLLFYDLLPDEFWEGRIKPSVAEIEASADEIQDNAPSEIQRFFSALNTEGNGVKKGEMARLLLQNFSQYEPLQPYVDQAVTLSAEPHMAPIPVIIGAYIVILAALPTKIEAKKGKLNIEFGNFEKIPKLVEKLTEFVKVLPSNWIDKIGK